MTPSQQKVYKIINGSKGISISQIASKLKRNYSTVREHVYGLRSKALIHEAFRKEQTVYYKTY